MAPVASGGRPPGRRPPRFTKNLETSEVFIGRRIARRGLIRRGIIALAVLLVSAVALGFSVRPSGGVPPAFEVFPAPAPVLPPPSACLPDPDIRPRIALIIDDIGYNRAVAERFVMLHPAITLSVLPRSPHGAAIARSARSRGREIMLHLPMEPLEYPAIDPGPGALTAAMTPAEIRRTLIDHLDAVPFVTGVNNHMGSRLTTLSAPMYEILAVLKSRHLFFIDSRTTESSLAGRTARLLQVPFARRDVFLDHDPVPSAIRTQIRLLIRIARLHGEAVGIGHPHKTTLEVLTAELSVITEAADLVTASRLVHTSG